MYSVSSSESSAGTSGTSQYWRMFREGRAPGQIQRKVMPRHQPADARVQRALFADVAECQVLGQEILFEAGGDGGVL